MSVFFFYFFSALTIAGALFVVLNRNPVNSAMCMIVALVGVAALFGLLHAYFLAMLQVVVYAGAVMVLFLFIIMLLDTEAGRPITASDALAGVLALLVLALGSAWMAKHYAFRVTPPVLEAPALPPTLQQLLIARLDSLGEAKDLAQRAAVLGRSFDRDVLAAMCDLEPDAVEEGIRRMIEEPRSCIEILQQLAAAEAALNRIDLAVFRHHIDHCVQDGIAKGDGETRKQLNELVNIFDRFGK